MKFCADTCLGRSGTQLASIGKRMSCAYKTLKGATPSDVLTLARRDIAIVGSCSTQVREPVHVARRARIIVLFKVSAAELVAGCLALVIRCLIPQRL